MTNDSYEVSQEPPRNDAGHPIHPEKGYPICGAEKSDRTTPTNHGRERDDIDYCLQRAGWGTDRDEGPCRNHPIKGEQWGESNPNFKDGSTSDYFKKKLSERQRDVYDEIEAKLGDPDEATNILRQVATRLILVGEHTNDPSMVREGRQLLSEFNIVDATDSVEVTGEVDHTHEHGLDEETDRRIGDMVDAMTDDE